MTGKDKRLSGANDLRKKAEEMALKNDALSLKNLETFSPEEKQHLFHELRVHQIELEMQNEELRRAQEKLEDSRAKSFDLYDLAPVGYFVLSEKGLVLEANLTVATLLNVARNTLIKQPFTRFIVPEDQNIYYLHSKQLFETDNPQVCEMRMLRKDSDSFWARLEAKAAKDGEGAPICRVVISDITERKHLIEKLRTSETFLNSIIENSPHAMWISDSQGTLIRLNPACRDLLRLTESEVVGKYNIFKDSIVVEQGHLPLVKQVFEQGATVRFTLRYNSAELKDLELGEHVSLVLDVTISPVLDDEGQVIHAIIQHVDITERLRAQEDVKTSEMRFRRFLDSTPDIVYLEDEQHRMIFVNKAYLASLGKTESEIIGKTVFDFMPEPVALQCDATDKLALKSNRVVINEEFFNDRQFETMKFRVDLGNGKTGVGGFIRDFTERRQADEMLRKSEKQLSDAMEMAHLGPWEYDVVNDLFIFNDHFFKLFRTTAEQVGGYTLSSAEYARRFVHPDEIHLVGQETLKAIETTDPNFNRQIEHRIIYSDGAVGHIVVRFFIIKDDQGRTVKTYGVNQDITERKQVEEDLRLFRTLIDYSNDAFEVVDPKTGRFLDVNDKGCRDLGYTREEFLSLRVSDIDTMIDPSTFTNIVERPPASDFMILEGIHRRKDGSTFPVELNIKLVHLDRDYMVTVVRDITARKEAEEEKKKLEAQLRQSQKMESIGQLAGGVAHDFNNLLTAILGYSEFVQTSLDQNDPLYKDMDEIIKAGQSAASLTKQLLAFSRKQIISTKVVNLNGIVEHSRKMLFRLIGEDIDLVFAGAPDLWSTKADPAQIEQILVNLAVNSRGAMPDGGKLTIETANAALDEEFCKNNAEALPGDFIVLAVSDNGVGMDKETQDRIFEPFFTTKERGKGTGLGLSTVYGIVKQHSGFIAVDSKPGEGATFKVYLPRVEKQEELIGKKAANSPVSGTETILLVEDQDTVRRLVKRILEQHDYQVLEADDGGDAYLKCEKYEGEIDLLLTDVIMPNLNGNELYKRIAKIKPGIRVLFMSGYTDDVIAHHGVLDPGTMFLHKPFKSLELLQKVRETLDAEPLGESKSTSGV